MRVLRQSDPVKIKESLMRATNLNQALALARVP
jgi:hypothetical protein